MEVIQPGNNFGLEETNDPPPDKSFVLMINLQLTKTLIVLVLELFATVGEDQVAVEPLVVELPLHGRRELRVEHFQSSQSSYHCLQTFPCDWDIDMSSASICSLRTFGQDWGIKSGEERFGPWWADGTGEGWGDIGQGGGDPSPPSPLRATYVDIGDIEDILQIYLLSVNCYFNSMMVALSGRRIVWEGSLLNHSLKAEQISESIH